MSRNFVWIATFLLLLVSASAHADVAPEPCAMSSEGAACQTYDGKDGTCVEVDGLLECLVAATSTSTGATSGGTTTPSPAPTSDDSSCAVVDVGQQSGGVVWTLLSLVGLAFAVRRRS